MFTERLKLLRKGKGLSQKELAAQLQVASGTVAMWECGKREPGYAMTIKIADYFDVSLDFLLGRTDIRDGHIITTPVELTGEGVISVEKSGSEELTPQEVEAIRRMLAGARQQ